MTNVSITLVSALLAPLMMCANIAAALTANKLEAIDNTDSSAFYGKIEGGIGMWSKLAKNQSYGHATPKNNSWLVGAALGYQFAPQFRSEISFIDMQKAHFSSSGYVKKANETLYTSVFAEQKLKSHALMLNGYYYVADNQQGDGFSYIMPYVTAGIGVARNQAGQYHTYIVQDDEVRHLNGGDKKTSHSLAWNIGAGVSLKMQDYFFIDLGYKHYDLGKFSTKAVTYTDEDDNVTSNMPKTKLKAHAITAALRLHF